MKFHALNNAMNPTHDLYHVIEKSWNNKGKDIFLEEGIKLEDGEAILESMVAHCIASVVLSHKGKIDPEQLARFVFHAATDIVEQSEELETVGNA